MPNQADSVYAQKPWADPYAQRAPWQSNEERLVSDALIAVTGVPGEFIALNTRPPLRQVILFPPKFGYRTDEFGIDDVARVDEVYPNARVDYSGSVSGFRGSSFPSLPVM